ncbi:MAG: tyrosine-protein phosphatase, partial [Bacteroidales bacterium]|nr:tyrosine-protein phosphatase [Bacteroidales bacterium]
ITKETGSDVANALKKIKDRKKMRSMIPRMPELYSSMVSDPGIRSNIAKAVRIILSNVLSGKATLFHCTVGKDRAGLVAATVLHILGRSDEEILKDYLKTNKSVHSQSNKYFFLVSVFRLDPVSASLVRKALTAS